MLNRKFRRLSVLTACTFGLGLGVVAWTASPLRAEDAPAATAAPADKDMDMKGMKESMMKVDAMMADPDHMKMMHKEVMRMQMIHQMMMSDPACKKMMDDMKANPDAMKMTDEDMMKMKKEIMNESAKNEDMMHIMMIHMMAKDSMMMKDKDMKHEDMKDKDATK